jgi:hypothetical protein
MEMLFFLPHLLAEGGGDTFLDVGIGNNFPKTQEPHRK